MTPYICLSHAAADGDSAARLSDMLARYGFRALSVSEQTEPAARARTLANATVLVALYSAAATQAGTVASDVRRAAERTYAPICVDLEATLPTVEPPTDPTAGSAGTGAAPALPRIPFPQGETPDRHAVGLFVHRLMIVRLSAIPGLFSPGTCDTDPLGVAIRHAVRAHTGDAEAAYALGRMYESGEGVPVLEAEAARHIAAAAAAHHPDARLHLGELYLEGHGVDANPAEAFRLFSEAAEADDLRGEYRRGLCYLLGRGVIKDPERAVYYLRRAARFGYPPALYRLGLLSRDGIGTRVHTADAIHHLWEACRRGVSSRAASGATDDAIALPDLYRRRGRRRPRCVSMRQLRRRLVAVGAVPALSERVFARVRATRVPGERDARYDLWVAPAGLHGPAWADLDGMAVGEPFSVNDAAVALGRLLESGCPTEGVPAHPTRAAAWYRYAAGLGHAEGCRLLGDLYRRGVGVPPDTAWAARLYRVAAVRGDEVGAFTLGVCLERGIGVRPDEAEAVRFYEQAANAGYAPAQNNLGGCYEYGRGVANEPLSAVEWYVRAADAGLPDAICRLGLCYECGRGVPVDLRQAFRHYETAARRGHGYALYRLGVCYACGVYPDGRETAEDIADRLPRHTRAAELWEAAGARGVAEAYYALAMCYAAGRGVRRDVVEEHTYLCRAAEGGSLRAHSRLGFAYLEGRGCAKNAAAARASFARAAALWRERRALYLLDDAPMPADVVTPSAAAGAAFYMEGYCTLNGIGEDGRADVSLPPVPRTPERVARAAHLFREAAVLEYVGAMEMLGDLYAYGVLTAPCEEAEELLLFDTTGRAASWIRATDPMVYYREAARIGSTRHSASGERAPQHGATAAGEVSPDCTIHALMSMARKSRLLAETLRAAGDADGADRAWREIWRSYAAAAEQGSADALVGMAECIGQGYGMAQNRPAAQKLLERAEHRASSTYAAEHRASSAFAAEHRASPAFASELPTSAGEHRAAPGVGQRTIASLWLGDFLRCGFSGECRLPEADDAYLCALATPAVGTEGSPYILEERRAARLAEDRRARAEVLYRLASFRSIYFSDDPDRSEAFSYLGEAILMGHAAARDDLARMYAYETAYAAATASSDPRGGKLSLRDRLRGASVRRRHRREEPDGTTTRDRRAVRSHQAWLSDYYTALWPEPRPFVYELRSVAVPSDVPDHVTAEVTPAMTVSALNYLGDCYFYGQGVPVHPAAAVTCYREAVALGGAFPRGIRPPNGLVWAQYSLGWCLLGGCGVSRDPREAVKWLTAAARYHAEACYVLAGCHERGEGVDVPDLREAIKYYRKALKNGFRAAEAKVEELEERLEELSEASVAEPTS